MRYRVSSNVQRPMSNVPGLTSHVQRPTSNVIWVGFQRRLPAGFSLKARILALLLFLLLFQSSCLDPRVSESPRLRVETGQPPARIISLAPSVTEILFELDLSDRVVGVTRFCDYPPEAVKKPRVGGYFDVNYEAILALEPDLVILLTEHEDAQDRLGSLGISTLAVNHSRIDGILDSVTVIGQACGVREKGKSLRRSLESRILEVQERFAVHSSSCPLVPSRPRVLVAVGRSLQGGSEGELFISGRDGFYDDLIRLAGGENAYREETLKFPAVSAEGLARLDPEIIIEMIPDLSPGKDRDRLLADWEDIPGLRAAREGRIHILGGDAVVVPGPRFVDLLEEMARIILLEEGGVSN